MDNKFAKSWKNLKKADKKPSLEQSFTDLNQEWEEFGEDMNVKIDKLEIAVEGLDKQIELLREGKEALKGKFPDDDIENEIEEGTQSLEEKEKTIADIDPDMNDDEFGRDEDGNKITEEMVSKGEAEAEMAAEREAEDLAEKTYEESKAGITKVGVYV